MITSLQLKNAGFNDDQITHWVDQQRGMLKKAGYSDMEINKAYGLRINKTEELNHIVNDIDTSLSLNIHKNDTTNLEKSNSVNTVVSKKDVTSNNALIDKNIKDNTQQDDIDINKMVNSGIAKIMRESSVCKYHPLNKCSPSLLLKYEEGQHYGDHTDFFEMWGSRTDYTAVINLNDDYDYLI